MVTYYGIEIAIIGLRFISLMAGILCDTNVVANSNSYTIHLSKYSFLKSSENWHQPPLLKISVALFWLDMYNKAKQLYRDVLVILFEYISTTFELKCNFQYRSEPLINC